MKRHRPRHAFRKFRNLRQFQKFNRKRLFKDSKPLKNTEMNPSSMPADTDGPETAIPITNPNPIQDENIQLLPPAERTDGLDDSPTETPAEPALGDLAPNSQDITPGQRTAVARRHYTLYELIRHSDYDSIHPDEPDAAAHVLSSMRRSVWGD